MHLCRISGLSVPWRQRGSSFPPEVAQISQDYFLIHRVVNSCSSSDPCSLSDPPESEIVELDLYDPFLDFAAFGAARGFGAALGPAFFGIFAAATLLAFFLNGLLSTPSDWRLRFGPFLDAGTERGVPVHHWWVRYQ